MPTVFRTNGKTLIIENLTHAQINPLTTHLFPADNYVVRIADNEAQKAFALMKAAGFIGDDTMMVNPRRLIQAENLGATARLSLDGFPKSVIVPVEFLEHLEGATPTGFPALETKQIEPEEINKPRRKKVVE